MEWITKLDLVQLANALVILIVGLAAGLGWKAGKKAPSPAQSGQSTVEVAGALVDSRSVDKLAGEVAGQSLAITAQAAATKDQTTAIHEHTEAVRDNTRAMLSLEKEIEEHRRELGRRR